MADMTTLECADPSKKLIIITGACGFIGSHLVEHFLAENSLVIGVDNFSTAYKANLSYLKSLPRAAENFHFVEADVCLPWSWFDCLDTALKSKLHLILHFASPASPPLYQKLALETMKVNTEGLERCLIAADAYKARVVFASTSEIYGDPSIHPQPETYWGNVNTVGPRSCYDESKRFGEALISTWNTVKKTRHGFVRIFNTYGPRMNPDDGRVIINFLTQAMKNQGLTIYGNGSQTRSFCFIDDLVNGICAYASKRDLTEPVNIGNSTEMSISELAQIVMKLFPQAKLNSRSTDLPTDDPLKRRPDISKAKALLNWSPKVPLEDGLRKMIVWLQSQTL